MRIYIGWAGERSHFVASALARFIPAVLQSVRVFMSADTMAGERWSPKIEQAVSGAEFALLCLTQDNLSNPWLAFEAGVLTGHGLTSVVPVLIDLSPVDIPPPFSLFQAFTLSRSDTYQFLRAINSKLEHQLSEHIFDQIFDAMWPRLAKSLGDAPPPPSERVERSQSSAPSPTTNDMIFEILQTVRQLSRASDRDA